MLCVCVPALCECISTCPNCLLSHVSRMSVGHSAASIIPCDMWFKFCGILGTVNLESDSNLHSIPSSTEALPHFILQLNMSVHKGHALQGSARPARTGMEMTPVLILDLSLSSGLGVAAQSLPPVHLSYQSNETFSHMLVGARPNI